MTGAWTLTDEGEFILNEPYKTKLQDAKKAATAAWQAAIYEFLAENTNYDVDYIHWQFVERAQRDESAVDIVDEFIIEALEGNL